MDLTTYYKIRDTIPTGSVIVFHGHDWVSKIIERTTGSNYSHCGVLAWCDSIANVPDKLMLIESTTLDKEPDISGKFNRGVNLIPLSQRLYSYQGEAWILPLKKELSPEMQKAGIEWLMSTEGKKIDYNLAGAITLGYYNIHNKLLQVILWPIIKLISSRESLKRVFCSQLCTQFEQKIGEVSLTIDPAKMLPDDVARLGCFAPAIKL